MTTLASSNRLLKCPICERIVDRQARQQVFCSTRCRKRAARERTAGALKIAGRYPHSGRGTNPHKSASKNNNLQWPKPGSSLFGNGPLNILGGGSWRWPGAGHLDGKTLAKIRHREVGGELVVPPLKSEADS
jgi:endogenous inhibitor of DNA gyrase (YacG/DUF329 family)